MRRSRRREAVLLGALTMWLAACGATGEAPAVDGDEAITGLEPRYRIAYNVLADPEADNYEVFVMEMDGSGSRNLTQHPAVDWAYTARGESLYMVSDRDDEKRRYHLYELDAGSGGLRRITAFRVRDSWPAVSPDGERLVVASAKDGTPDLYLIDREGRELRRLTDDEAADRDPVFSPDGTGVVWASSRSGVDELWRLDLDTGEASRLTHFPEDDPGIDEHGYHAGPPFWQPARDHITFCSKRNGNHSIFSIRPDGSDLEQLTGDDFDECWHAWSPDGRYLAYDGTDTEGNYDIYLRDMETGSTTRLTDDPRYEQAPVFLEVP